MPPDVEWLSLPKTEKTPTCPVLSCTPTFFIIKFNKLQDKLLQQLFSSYQDDTLFIFALLLR